MADINLDNVPGLSKSSNLDINLDNVPGLSKPVQKPEINIFEVLDAIFPKKQEKFQLPESFQGTNNGLLGLSANNVNTDELLNPVSKRPIENKPSKAESIIRNAYLPDFQTNVNIGENDDYMSVGRAMQMQKADEEAAKSIDFLKAKAHPDGTPITKAEKDAKVKEILDLQEQKLESKKTEKSIIQKTYLPLLNKYQGELEKTQDGEYEPVEYNRLVKEYGQLNKKYDFDVQEAKQNQKDLAAYLPEIVQLPDKFSQGSQNDINYLDKFNDSELIKQFGELGIDKAYIAKINDADNAEAAKIAYNTKQSTYDDIYSLDSPSPFHSEKTQTKGNPKWVNELFQKIGGQQVLSNFKDLYDKSSEDYNKLLEEYNNLSNDYKNNPTEQGYNQLQEFYDKQLKPAKNIVDKRSSDLKRLMNIQSNSYQALNQYQLKKDEELNLDLSTFSGQMLAAYKSLANKNAHIFEGLEQVTNLPERLFLSKDEFVANRIAAHNRTKDLTYAVPEQYYNTPVIEPENPKSPKEWYKRVNWSNLVAKNLEQSAFSLEIGGITAMTGGGANAIIPVTYAMTYGDFLYNARELGLNEKQASALASFQALTESFTERISPLEAKFFDPKTYTGGIFKQLGKEQIIRELYKSITGKEVKETALQAILNSSKEGLKKLGKSGLQGAYVVLQETAEELAADPLNNLADRVIANNAKGYTYDPVTLETLKNTAITSASTMALMGLWGMGTELVRNKVSSYQLDLATKPDYYLSSLEYAMDMGMLPDFNFKNGIVIPSKQFYGLAKDEVNKLSSIYQTNKDIIDNLEDKSEQASYIGVMRNQQDLSDKLAKLITSRAPEKEIEKLKTKILENQEYLDKLGESAFENMALPKEERYKKQEEKVFESTKNQFTDEYISSLIFPEQIRALIKNLEDRYTYAPTSRMKELVYDTIDKLSNRIQEIGEKPTSEVVEEINNKKIEEEKIASSKEETTSHLDKINEIKSQPNAIETLQNMADEFFEQGDEETGNLYQDAVDELENQESESKSSENKIEAPEFEKKFGKPLLKEQFVKIKGDGTIWQVIGSKDGRIQLQTLRKEGDNLVVDKTTNLSSDADIEQVFSKEEGLGRISEIKKKSEETKPATRIEELQEDIRRQKEGIEKMREEGATDEFLEKAYKAVKNDEKKLAELQAKVDDLEKRRQEELNNRAVYDRQPSIEDGEFIILNDPYNTVYKLNVNNRVVRKDSDGLWTREGVDDNTMLNTARKEGFQKNKEVINAKYDAELKKLLKPTNEQESKQQEQSISVDINKEIEQNNKEKEQRLQSQKKHDDFPRVFNPFGTVAQQVNEKEGYKPSTDKVVVTQVNTFANLRKQQKQTGKSYTDLGYAITVMSPEGIDLKYFKAETTNALSSGRYKMEDFNKSKIAVITDPSGNILYWNEDGTPSTKEQGGLIAYQNLRGSFDKNGDFKIANKPTQEELKKKGLEEYYATQEEAVKKLRETEGKVTLEIEEITPGAPDINRKNPKKLSEFDDITIHVVGSVAKFYFNDSQEDLPIYVANTTINDVPDLVDGIVALMDMNNKEGLPEYMKDSEEERWKYIDKFVITRENILRFRPNSEGGNVIIRNNPVNTSKAIDFIKSLELNVLKRQSMSDTFMVLTWDGKKFTEKNFNTYQEFLTPILETPVQSKDRFNSHISFGSVISQKENKPATEETVKVEEQKPELEKPQNKPRKKFDKSFGRKDNTLGSETDKPLPRLRSFRQRTNPETEAFAKEWTEKYLKLSGAEFNDLRDIVNSEAFATWYNGAITLWSGGKYTDAFHEAFHDFSQLFLTKEQKVSLYNEAANTELGKKALQKAEKQKGRPLTELERYNILEELLAEDFYNYMTSEQKLILNGRPKRNSIFRKIYNYLKNLLWGKPSVQEVYEQLSTLKIKRNLRDNQKAFFGKLNKQIEANGNPIFDYYKSNSIRNAIDSVIADEFRANGYSISELFHNPKSLEKVYNNVYNRFSEIFDKRNADYEKLGEDANENTVNQLENELENLNLILSNWESVVKNHLQESKFFKISGKILSDEVVSDLELSPDEFNKEKYGDDNEDAISAKDKASNQIIYLIASMSKFINRDGILVPKENDVIPSIQDIADFETTWNQIAKTLENTPDYNQIWQKLQDLASKNQQYVQLLQSLPHPEEELDIYSNQLKNQFINVFSQPIVPLKTVSLEWSEGGVKAIMRNATPNVINKVKSDWDLSLQEIPNKYMIGEGNEQKQLDLNSLVKDFPKLDTKNKKKQFLKAIGFELSEQALESPEMAELLADDNYTINGILNVLKQYNNLKNGNFPENYIPSEAEIERFKKPIYSVIDITKNKIYPQNKEIAERIGLTNLVGTALEQISAIVNIELQFSDKFFTDNVLNSEGNSVWSIRPWSQQSWDYQILNNVEKYPDYDSLKNDPVASYFHIDNNPDADNIYIRALFDLETGKRRLDKNQKPVKINLYNHEGLKVSREYENNIFLREGKKTTSLSRFEKLAQDISVFLKYGNKEHLRYGDKTTSRGTEVVFKRFNKTTAADPHLPVDVRDFKQNILPTEAWLIVRNQLKTALLRNQQFAVSGIGKNWANYKDNMNQLSFFNGILPTSLEKSLIEEVSKEGVDILSVIDRNEADIKKAITKFFEDEVKDIKNELNLNKVLANNEYLDKTLLKNFGFDTVIKAFAVNSWIVNTEHVRLHFQDVRFYANKGGKGTFKEPFKRFSKSSSTGTIAINDGQVNKFLTSLGRAEKQYYDETHPDNPSKPFTEDGTVNTTIFNDYKIDAHDFINSVAKIFKESEDFEAFKKAYSDITATDAMGVCTFDWYRTYELRTGNDNWSIQKEELYNKIARKEKLTKEDEKNAYLFFPPKKIRVVGRVWDKTTNAWIPVDYKFAVSPLLNTVIDNTSWGIIKDNMIRQNIGIATFGSASKHSAILNPDGQFNQMYIDGKPNTNDYVINPVRTEYIIEVVTSPEDYKEKVTLSTQQRDLLFVNQFDGGIPVDYKGKADFNTLSEAEKVKASKIYSRYKEFADIIEAQIKDEQDKLLKQLDAVPDSYGNYQINEEKFSELLEREFKVRGLPDNVLQSITVQNGKFKYPLDASIKRDTIERVLLSIIDNRLRKQKSYGEGLIQASSIGYEPITFNRVDTWEKTGGNDLPFYSFEGRTLKDGTKVTSAQKVKIAIQGNFKNLLQHPDVLELAAKEQISALQALNKLIKDESWLDKADNRNLITLTGVRIPVQGPNSQEFMEVYEFLPEEAGNVIIVSPALVAKSGGDFDWDKITTLFPNNYIDSNGKVVYYKGQTTETIGLLYDDLKSDLEQYLKDYKKASTTDVKTKESSTFISSNKLIDSIFGDVEIKELIEETFGKDRIPSKEEFISSFKKKSRHNRLNEIIREVLEDSHNFEQLITPNSTSMFEPIADKIRNATNNKKNSYAQIGTVTENLNQFESNTVGKGTLGIGAIQNSFFSKMQSAGAYLNPVYRTSLTLYDGKLGNLNKQTRNRLPHNKTKEGFISLSGVKDAFGQFRISESISQLMNGWVDVAKKDWIFYINGRKEVAPVMLLMAQQGVPKDINIAFNNQPVIKEYVRNLQNYKSSIVKMKNDSLYRNAKRNAIYDTLMSFIPDGYIVEILQGDKLAKVELKVALKSAYENSDVRKFWGVLSGMMRQLADENSELFDYKKFSKFAIPNENGKIEVPKTDKEKFAQALYLIQFLEFGEQQGILDNIRRATNQDRAKPADIQSSQWRALNLKNVEDYELVPKEIIQKLANESTTKGFSGENGIDSFVAKMANSIFEVTNSPMFNKFLLDEWNKPSEKSNISFADKNNIRDKWVRAVKEDFILFLYQNYVYKPNSAEKIVDDVRRMMNYDTSLAIEMEAIKKNYPELVDNNLFLSYLTRDNSTQKVNGKPRIVSLKIRKQNIDNITSDILTQDFKKLLDFSEPEYSAEEQQVIQTFAKKVARFAFIQSGLSKSDISFAELIPQESYAEDIAPIISAYKDLIYKNEKEAYNILYKFYQKFKQNNKKFFSENNQQIDQEGYSSWDIEFTPEARRFKDYRTKDIADLLNKQSLAQQIRKNEFLESLKKKVSTATYTKDLAKNNPKNLYVFAENAKRGGLFGTTVILGERSNPNKNTVGIILRNLASDANGAYLSDDNITKNKENIDNAVQNIIQNMKDGGYTGLVFPTDLTENAKLAEKAPKTYEYLRSVLIDNFGFELPNISSTFVDTDNTMEEPQIQNEEQEFQEWLKANNDPLLSEQELRDYFKKCVKGK